MASSTIIKNKVILTKMKICCIIYLESQNNSLEGSYGKFKAG